MPPPSPPEREPPDEPDDPDECDDPPPLDDPEECDEEEDPLLLDGLLTLPDPPPLRVDPEDDDPEVLLPRVDVPEPRPELEELPLPLGVSRAPPIEPITRRTVSPAPRHESVDVPRVDEEPDGLETAPPLPL